MAELYDAIMTMPKELPMLYSRILERMFSGLTNQQENNIRRILAWLAFAKRPLRRHEVLHAASITYDDPALNERNMLYPTVMLKCKPLAEELSDGAVAFIHYTVEEYVKLSLKFG